MLIPTERIEAEMLNEESGVWYMPLYGGQSASVLFKSASHVSRSIVTGARLELVVDVIERRKVRYLCAGFKLYDSPTNPLIVRGVVLDVEQQRALLRVLRDNGAPFFLFDDFARTTSRAEIRLDPATSRKAVRRIGLPASLYSGRFNDVCPKIIDAFEKDFLASPKRKKTAIEVSTSIGEFRHILLGVVGDRGVQVSQFNADEGGYHEKLVWHVLSDLFGRDVYFSPQVPKPPSLRELTDVLCIGPNALYLIEAKALSVLTRTLEQSSKRKRASLEDHLNKALKQLRGACRALESDPPVTVEDGEIIHVDKDLRKHLIALVSELPAGKGWAKYLAEAASLAIDYNAFVHILDVRELIMLQRSAEGNTDRFDRILRNRFIAFAQVGSFEIRSAFRQ